MDRATGEKLGKVAVILFILTVAVVVFVLPAIFVLKSLSIGYIYTRYVDEVSNLTGINHYLITAAALVMFIPFFYAANMTFSGLSVRELVTLRWGQGATRRRVGLVILLAMGATYNVGLYYVTKDMAFAFSTGAPQKWYALTPDGVRFYDRPGVDPQYGKPLRPVTPEIIRRLKLVEKGEFKPVEPGQAAFFNPITGEAQVWYYRYPDGALEFYDKPGHHPLTGEPLEPATKEIYFEWQKSHKRRSSVVPGAPGTRISAPVGGPMPGQTAQATAVEVRSNPEGAETYLNWRAKGETPTQLDGKDSRGLLVLVKDGHRAAFKRIDGMQAGEVFDLPPDHPASRTRLLLLIEGDEVANTGAVLRSRLLEEGFSVLGTEETREFKREMELAGGRSHRGLRAWARARFETDLLAVARLRQTTRELSGQGLESMGVQNAVKGTVRAEVTVEVEVVDLRSGDTETVLSTKGSGFGLDRAQGIEKAAMQATTESAKILRQRLRG